MHNVSSAVVTARENLSSLEILIAKKNGFFFSISARYNQQFSNKLYEIAHRVYLSRLTDIVFCS